MSDLKSCVCRWELAYNSCLTFDEMNNVQLANHTSIIALLTSLIMDAEKIETDECGNRVLISTNGSVSGLCKTMTYGG